MILLKLDISQQTLSVFEEGDKLIHSYLVSTAAKGVGEEYGSFQTPRGWHQIRAKIGHDQELNTVFIRRRPSGQIYSDGLAEANPGQDWILTRIMWLSGLEPGKNRLGRVDTMRRFIYIHGSPDRCPMGLPGSKGCIRMHNADLLDLFDRVSLGTKLYIY